MELLEVLRRVGRGEVASRCGTFGTLQVGLRDESVGSGVDGVLLSRDSWALGRNLGFILQLLEGSQQEGKGIEGRPLQLGLGE